jgi:amino acid transporter
VLLIQYLGFFVPELGRVGSWIVAVAMIWIATWLNLRGTRAVGRASGWFVAVVLAPFAAVVVFAIARILGSSPTAAPFGPFHAAGTSFLGALGIGVSQAIWNYSGWDNASTFSGEIDDASRNYPRALSRALPMVTLVYLAAIVPVLAVTDWQSWTDGAWPHLAASVAGPWLGAWMAVAGMVSAFALFNALLLAYSRIPLVLAQDGLLPAALGRLDDRGVPRNAVIVSAIGYSVCAVLPFGGLLAGDVLLYTAALAMEFAALLRLRHDEPELRGAFRVPLGVFGLGVLAAMPILFIVTAVVLEIQSHEIGLPGVIVAVVLALIGPIWYRITAPVELR